MVISHIRVGRASVITSPRQQNTQETSRRSTGRKQRSRYGHHNSRLNYCSRLTEFLANTISKLFSAQREHPHAEPVPSSQPPHVAATPAAPQKNTLHSFWHISSNPVEPAHSNTMMVDADPAPSAQPLKGSQAVTSIGWNCEDCEGHIRFEDEMSLDDSIVARETLCCCCRRRVCDGCAVLWDERLCLGCARMR